MTAARSRAHARAPGIESGQIAYGCLAPAEAGDHHLLADLHALIQIEDGEEKPGLRAGALLISALRSTSPFVLINVALGDQAQISQRRCGFPVEEADRDGQPRLWLLVNPAVGPIDLDAMADAFLSCTRNGGPKLPYKTLAHPA